MDAGIRWIGGLAVGVSLLMGLFALRRGWVPPWRPRSEDPRAYGWFLILSSGGLFAWVAFDLDTVGLLLVGISAAVYLVLRLSARRRARAGSGGPSSSKP